MTRSPVPFKFMSKSSKDGHLTGISLNGWTTIAQEFAKLAKEFTFESYCSNGAVKSNVNEYQRLESSHEGVDPLYLIAVRVVPKSTATDYR